MSRRTALVMAGVVWINSTNLFDAAKIVAENGNTGLVVDEQVIANVRVCRNHADVAVSDGVVSDVESG